MKHNWTEEEKNKIKTIISDIARYLDDNKIPPNISATAVLIITVKLAATSLNTDAQIIEKFKLSLLNERTQNATKQ